MGIYVVMGTSVQIRWSCGLRDPRVPAPGGGTALPEGRLVGWLVGFCFISPRALQTLLGVTWQLCRLLTFLPPPGSRPFTSRPVT